MGYLDKDGLSRAFTKLKTLIDKKQDKMKQIGLPSSGATYKKEWIKFATIDLSSSNAWYVCSGTLSFTQGEGGNALGTLKFHCRNGGTAGVIDSSSLTWVSLSDNSYAGSVAYVKAANGKYDMYYKPLKDYETPWIALVDCTAYNLFTFSTNSYVASITAFNTSFVASHASKANGIVVSDTRNDNSAPKDAAFDKHMLTADFKDCSKIGSPTGFNGTYCGVLSLAPWADRSGGHGYQLAFGYEQNGHPRLALRGSDLSATSWNSWYKVYTSDDKPTLSELGAAAASHSHTKSQITDFAHTHDDRYYTESEIDTKVEKVQAHIANTTIHITAAERAKWNAKADITIGTAKPTSSTSGIFYIQTN